MATMRVVCSQAIGLLGAKALGDDPSAEELDAALTAAQGMFLSMVGAGIGGPLTDVVIADDYEAGENERIFNTSGGAVTITLPETYIDAVTGIERPPLEGAVVQVAGGDTSAYVKSRGAWVQLNGLTLDSTQPLGEEFDRNIAAMVAVRLAPELQVGVPDMTQSFADFAKRSVSARFGPRLKGKIDRGVLRRFPPYSIYTDV